MKRVAALLAVVFSALVLSACGGGEETACRDIPVSVVERPGLTVEDNGRWVAPGESVTFRLRISQGWELIGVKCAGEYRLTAEGKTAQLELLDVRYPLRAEVELEAAEDPDDPAKRPFRSITYRPNGGDGATQIIPYNIREHSRPNTSNGVGLFVRAGHTLTGWNTAPDGSGTAVGLGSRATVPLEGLTLYAQWQPWTAAEEFDFERVEDGLRITGYHGTGEPVVVPQEVDGRPVKYIGRGAFDGCPAKWVILPPGLHTVETKAFTGAALEELTLFDDIEVIADACFPDCASFRTVHINAVEDPYGTHYRRESLYADKVDLLINARGKKKLVFYGGCSTWYNLIGDEAARRFPSYTVVNMGLNGTVNSLAQMEIMGTFLEEGDILFHAPELSSQQQLLLSTKMYNGDDKLWCGLEYNYDLLSLVDLRRLGGGVFNSLTFYLGRKKPGGSYDEVYKDADGNTIMDVTGSISFVRTQALSKLEDSVTLDPAWLDGGLPELERVYGEYGEKGVRIYVSYGCVNWEGLPQEEQGNGPEMERRFRELIGAMDGPVVVSRLQDYTYVTRDFYDTHYHLLTPQAYDNTRKWLRDLGAQMAADGLPGGLPPQ